MQTSETLNKAADLIEERGWVRGVAGMNISGPHCLEGAIQAAMGTTERAGCARVPRFDYIEDACPAGAAVRAHLADRGFRFLFMWNDEPGRTPAEVIEVLRATAVIEAARESAPVEVSA